MSCGVHATFVFGAVADVKAASGSPDVCSQVHCAGTC